MTVHCRHAINHICQACIVKFNDLGPSDIGQQVIAERAKVRAPYDQQSKFSQELKDTFRFSPGWKNMTPAERESLDNIANKIARVLTGDPHEADSWKDIAGYATLIYNLTTKGVPV